MSARTCSSRSLEETMQIGATRPFLTHCHWKKFEGDVTSARSGATLFSFRNLITTFELSRQRKLSRECGAPALLERRGCFFWTHDVDAEQR